MSSYPQKFKLAEQQARDIKLIHIAKQKLGMEDDVYRAILRDRFSAASSKELDFRQRKQLLEHFQTLGFKPVRAQRPGQSHGSLSADKQAIERKIGALLKQLDASWPYAYAIVKKQFPEVSRFEFLTVEQMGKLASALQRTLSYRQKP